MNYREMFESMGALNALMTLKLPVAVSLKLAKMRVSITPAGEAFETARQSIYDGYKYTPVEGELVPDAVRGKLEELLDSPTDVVVPDITTDVLGDCEIQPMTLMQLAWLFKDMQE